MGLRNLGRVAGCRDLGFRVGEFSIWGSVISVFRVHSPPQVDRIWLWIYYNKIPMYPILYLLKGTIGLRVWDKSVGSRLLRLVDLANFHSV